MGGSEMKIYISGKISGLDLDQAEEYFELYENQIIEIGHEPVNPMKVHANKICPEWLDYMRADIKALMDCDAVYAMPNWRQSIGARIEVGLAHDLGIPVYYRLGDIK